MATLPTTFGLSTLNAATQHNLNNSPLLRLPAELRATIWTLCLSNVDILISARSGGYKTENLYPDWQSLSELGIGFDCMFWHTEGERSVPTDGPIVIRHHSSDGLTTPHPQWPEPGPDFPHGLPQLWRVCKLVYNETYDLPFAAKNTFYFQDFIAFMLHHKHDPKSMERIKSLSLSRWFEEGLIELIYHHVDDSDDAEVLPQVKSELKKVLPALVNVRIESTIARRTSRVNEDPSLLQRYGAKWIQREIVRVRSVHRHWESLVARVVVEEASIL